MIVRAAVFQFYSSMDLIQIELQHLAYIFKFRMDEVPVRRSMELVQDLGARIEKGYEKEGCSLFS